MDSATKSRFNVAKAYILHDLAISNVALVFLRELPFSPDQVYLQIFGISGLRNMPIFSTAMKTELKRLMGRLFDEEVFSKASYVKFIHKKYGDEDVKVETVKFDKLLENEIADISNTRMLTDVRGFEITTGEEKFKSKYIDMQFRYAIVVNTKFYINYQ